MVDSREIGDIVLDLDDKRSVISIELLDPKNLLEESDTAATALARVLDILTMKKAS